MCPPRPREAGRLLIPSSFTDRAGLRPCGTVSALPSPSTLRFSWRSPFRGLTTVRLRYNLPTCSPPCRSRPRFRPGYGDSYIRAFGGLVTRTAAGHHYSGNWASSTGGTHRITPARTPTSVRCNHRTRLLTRDNRLARHAARSP